MDDQEAIDKAYAAFHAIYADSRLLRSPSELAAAIRAGGLSYADVTPQWLRDLNPAWVYLESASPFQNDDLNRAYWRLAT